MQCGSGFNIDLAYMSLPNKDNYFQPWPVGLCCQPSNPHKQNRCSVVKTIRINRMQLIKDFNFCKILLIFIPFLIDIPNCNSYGFVNDKHTMHVPKKKRYSLRTSYINFFFFSLCLYCLLGCRAHFFNILQSELDMVGFYHTVVEQFVNLESNLHPSVCQQQQSIRINFATQESAFRLLKASQFQL